MNNVAPAIAKFVGRKIRELDRIDKDDDGGASARANLAVLRRGLDKSPVDVPAVWAITLADAPDEISPTATGAAPPKPTRAEWAVHIALSFYALHRQGKSESMNAGGSSTETGYVRGPTFGAALGALRRDPNKEAGIVRRFNAVATANDLREFSRHALGVVQMLRAAERPLKFDYPAFAVDLFWYQFPDHRAQTALKWGRDFWRNVVNDADGIDAPSSENSSLVQEK